MQYANGWLVSVATLMVMPPSSYASIADVPSSFRKDVQCMMDVLASTPQVDQVESGALLDGGWRHPYVQFHYRELDGRDGTVRFVAQRLVASKDGIQYLAFLNGLYTPGDALPPDLGAGEIARQWELQCRISAVAIFE